MKKVLRNNNCLLILIFFFHVVSANSQISFEQILKNPNDLFLFQKILSEIDLIETFKVKEFNNRFAYVNIKYYGKINKIREKLNKLHCV